jgi:hypothetical protein
MTPVKPPALQFLFEIWPDGNELLTALAKSQCLHQTSSEPGASLLDSLYRILSLPRAPGLSPILVPGTNTQKIAVPFPEGGELSSETCVVAARIGKLIREAPAEYVRWVDQLTSLPLTFFVTRFFADSKTTDTSVRVLGQYCQVIRFSSRTIRLFLPVDSEGLSRAIIEQFHVRPCAGEGSRETRHAIDVLVQSALMNFLMSGAYSSARDSHRGTGERGISYDDQGVMLLDNVILRAGGSITLFS